MTATPLPRRGAPPHGVAPSPDDPADPRPGDAADTADTARAFGAGSVGQRASAVAHFLIYGLVAVVLGAIGFALTLALVVGGISTVVVWIGLPILALGVVVASGFAAAERGIQSTLLGNRLPTPAAKQPPPGAGRVRQLLTPLADPQSWLNSLWVLINFLLSLVTFPLAAAWVAGSIAMIGGPAASLILRQVLAPGDYGGLDELLSIPGPAGVLFDLGAQFAVGLLFLLTLSPVVRGLAALHAGVGRGLLSARYEEQQHLARTEHSRAAGRAAESAALRRLERDLHDGPQQRLVRANIDLARAEQLAAADPEQSLRVMGQTRAQIASTLDELRRLSRGIAPPVLVDRGLAAALTELAGITPLPTRVDCPDLELPDHVEIGIYYVVSEALTNAAKHSQAQLVTVEVTQVPEGARVRIDDDGIGGAEFAAGHGLSGLAERIASLEGHLTVRSPRGAGTRIEAVIPCAS